MKTLVIIRGISGSGKSTYAKSLVGYKHFEADEFFMVDGVYKYDPKFIKCAHEWCFANTLKALLEGDCVCVSNTFTRIFEMQRYFDITFLMDIKILVREMKTEYTNTHGVPPKVIQSMKDRWEEIPEDIIKKYNIEIV